MKQCHLCGDKITKVIQYRGIGELYSLSTIIAVTAKTGAADDDDFCEDCITDILYTNGMKYKKEKS